MYGWWRKLPDLCSAEDGSTADLAPSIAFDVEVDDMFRRWWGNGQGGRPSGGFEGIYNGQVLLGFQRAITSRPRDRVLV